MEEFSKHFLEGVRRAKALGSDKRLKEAKDALKAARQQWPHEDRVMELLDMLV